MDGEFLPFLPGVYWGEWRHIWQLIADPATTTTTSPAVTWPGGENVCAGCTLCHIVPTVQHWWWGPSVWGDNIRWKPDHGPQQIPDPSADSKLNPCLCSISWSSVVLGGGRWPEAGGGILPFSLQINRQTKILHPLLNCSTFRYSVLGRGEASILPWCNVLYAVVDSRWPQKPGLCIDAAGAPPDGMVATAATVGTSAMWWGHWSPLEQVVGGTNNNVGSIPRDNNKMDYRCHSAFNSAQVLSVMKDPDMFNASLICQLVYMCVIKRLQWLSGVLKHMLTIAWRYQQTDKV